MNTDGQLNDRLMPEDAVPEETYQRMRPALKSVTHPREQNAYLGDFLLCSGRPGKHMVNLFLIDSLEVSTKVSSSQSCKTSPIDDSVSAPKREMEDTMPSPV
jgi:hypothetical protein